MSASNKAASGVKWTSMALIINVIMQLAQLSFLSRLLDPYQIGLITIIMLVNTFSEMFLDMGISKAIIQKKEIAKNELDSLYWLNVIAGLFIFVVLFSSRDFIASTFSSHELINIIAVSSCVFLIVPFGQQFVALLEKNLEFKMISVAEISAVFVQFVSAVSLAYFGFGAMSVAIAMLISNFAKVVIMNILGRHINRPSLHFNYAETKPFLNFGIYQALDQFVNYINNNVSSFVIGKFINVSSLGGFNIANNFAVNIPSKINPVITRVMFPYLATLQEHPEKLITSFSKSLFLIGFVNIALLAELYFNAQELVTVMFGIKWLWIVPMIKLLCFAGLFRAICNPSGVLFMAIGRMRLGFWLNFIKTFVFILPIISAGAYFYGAYGVIYSLIIVQLANFLINGIVASKITSLLFYKYVINFLTAILYSLPLVLTLFILDRLSAGRYPPLATLSVKAVIGLAVFIGTMYFSGRAEMRDVMISVKLRRS